MGKRTLDKRFAAAIAIAALLCAAVLAMAGCSCTPQPANEEVTVPDVTQMTSEKAKKTLEDAGLKVGKTTTASSDTVPKDVVISQDPAAKAKAAKGSEVALVVSSGAASGKVTVPDLTGMTQDDAEKALTDISLVPAIGDPVDSDTIEAGLVCQQSADPGTQVDPNTTVTFNLSQGEEEVTVPDLSGMTFDDARQQLLDLKLGVDQLNDYSNDVPAGNVISQSVDPGTKVVVGTTVTLDVSLGAQPSGPVTVPDVSGMSGTDASAAMGDAGLTLDYDVRNPDRVLSGTDPQAGTQVDAGTIVEAQYPPNPQPQPTGGWDFNGQAAAAVSPDAQAVFDAGVSDGRTAIAVLATRNGSDYVFLCKSDTDWSIVSMSSDGKGGATLLTDEGIDISNVITADGRYGDWTVADAPGVDLQPADAQKAFDAASADYAGVRLSPVATLGTQVVSGINYLAICIGAPVTANPANQIFVATIYAAPDGSSSFSDVSQLDLVSYTS